jgi:uncharacterized protein
MSLKADFKMSQCPLCRKPVDPLHKPFCSQGCRDRDLLNWLDESYRVPSSPNEVDEEESPLDRDPEP